MRTLLVLLLVALIVCAQAKSKGSKKSKHSKGTPGKLTKPNPPQIEDLEKQLQKEMEKAQNQMKAALQNKLNKVKGEMGQQIQQIQRELAAMVKQAKGGPREKKNLSEEVKSLIQRLWREKSRLERQWNKEKMALANTWSKEKESEVSEMTIGINGLVQQWKPEQVKLISSWNKAKANLIQQWIKQQILSKPCGKSSDCGSDQCCVFEYTLKENPFSAIGRLALQGAGTCQPYKKDGEKCDALGPLMVQNKYINDCPCSPSMNCASDNTYSEHGYILPKDPKCTEKEVGSGDEN
ncbi:uncharacterized protein LOC106177821 [Lingula anatina]|uniref:Uncharacterized protein LOC106177821 n=1 Tax=Lingula anatina TaxID=7574 RepID=A0A1S3K1M4_LINAN|nr:uncharacterized protein LOC106177821 [Lingula anatina]|eukprot:XP_013416171.1 uncharacterized protein LOC106177821 [Lingula anatina]